MIPQNYRQSKAMIPQFINTEHIIPSYKYNNQANGILLPKSPSDGYKNK